MDQTIASDFPATLNGVPGPKGLPLFGNLFQLEKVRLHQILESWADQFGSCYKLKLGRKDLSPYPAKACSWNVLFGMIAFS